MRIVAWIVRIGLFIVLLGFAVKNTDPVVVRFYLGTEWQAPLVFVLLIVFIVGAAAGIAATLAYLFRQRRQMVELRKQLRSQPTGETNSNAVR